MLNRLFHSHDFVVLSIRRESKQKLGDVMKQLAPFLKLTTEYVTNLGHAQNVIREWQVKSPRFASIISSLEVCVLIITLNLMCLVLCSLRDFVKCMGTMSLLRGFTVSETLVADSKRYIISNVIGFYGCMVL